MMPFLYLDLFFMGRKISSLVIILDIKASPSFSLSWKSSAEIFLKVSYVQR